MQPFNIILFFVQLDDFIDEEYSYDETTKKASMPEKIDVSKKTI